MIKFSKRSFAVYLQ